MPVSVVIGGQYGSEGKGKVALDIVRRSPNSTIAVRPGGTNSGHTAYSNRGKRLVLRQLPAAAIDRNVKVVLPAGAYIDTSILEREIEQTGIDRSNVIIDPRANVIRPEHIAWEWNSDLVKGIGSTGSGTGGAVLSRLARFAPALPPASQAYESPELLRYLGETASVLDDALSRGERVIVEGTQGFGLSPIHGDAWPKCTSRDTTAAAFLSEAGISPIHVDQIVLVLRCHAIRVAGDSGPLPNEIDWEEIAQESGRTDDLREFTSVTHKLRRVARFNPDVARRAIMINAPTEIVLNHVDYIDGSVRGSDSLSDKAAQFVEHVEMELGRAIDWIGTDEKHLHPRRTQEGAYYAGRNGCIARS